MCIQFSQKLKVIIENYEFVNPRHLLLEQHIYFFFKFYMKPCGVFFHTVNLNSLDYFLQKLKPMFEIKNLLWYHV